MQNKRLIERFPLQLVVSVAIGMAMAELGILLPDWASDVLQGTLASGLVLFLLHYESRRIKELNRRLFFEGEFNHHVRNAVHTILLAERFYLPNHQQQVIETAEKLIERLQELSPREQLIPISMHKKASELTLTVRQLKEQALRNTFPAINWDEPIHIRTCKGAQGYGCRYCIALYGLHGSEVANLPQTREEALHHIHTVHPHVQ